MNTPSETDVPLAIAALHPENRAHAHNELPQWQRNERFKNAVARFLDARGIKNVQSYLGRYPHDQGSGVFWKITAILPNSHVETFHVDVPAPYKATQVEVLQVVLEQLQGGTETAQTA
jgi:hypothetical protein